MRIAPSKLAPEGRIQRARPRIVEWMGRPRRSTIQVLVRDLAANAELLTQSRDRKPIGLGQRNE